MKVAIIGCGLIGKKRAQNLLSCQLAACVDLDLNKAEALAKQYPSCKAYTQWQDVVTQQHIDIIIISTIHACLAEIALVAIQHGKHVLIEKPAAKSCSEIVPLIQASKEINSKIRVGFNHRFHRGLQKARKLIDEGSIGDLMFIRGRYGHGGRIGYENEWRADAKLSGGGELLDQGMHLIDLSRWFLGDFVDIQAFAHTFYWPMAVDDNGFLLLKTASQRTAFLHASCTEWKNLFSFEIYGKTGKIDIHGLGGSYGVERITLYQMTPAMGPPETSAWEYPMADNSWEEEFKQFIDDIKFDRQPCASLQDAYAALSIVEQAYRMSNL